MADCHACHGSGVLWGPDDVQPQGAPLVAPNVPCAPGIVIEWTRGSTTASSGFTITHTVGAPR